MSPPRTTLRAFLATARSALYAAKGGGSSSATSSRLASPPVTLVVGNESADLDSLCSALLFAYFRSHQRLSSSSLQQQSLHIPLCNIPRADLSLRPEFLAVLHDVDLGPDDVLTLSDVFQQQQQHQKEGNGEPEGGKLAPESTRWILVDHNALTGPLAEHYSGRVVGCIDHHDDEGKVPRPDQVDDEDKPVAVRIIEKSGSCSSLVVEYCRETWDSLSSSSSSSPFSSSPTIPSEKADDQLSRLILAPLLIDTTNLADPHKTTDHDTKTATFVEDSKISPTYWDGDGEGGYDRTAYFNRLSQLKSDISGMSIRDILRKDYKEWTEEGGNGSSSSRKKKKNKLKLGTSSMPRSLGYLVRGKWCKGDPNVLSSELRAWADERELDLAAVLTSFNDGEGEGEGNGEFRRELLVWARSSSSSSSSGKDNDEGMASDVAVRFADTYGEKLGLKVWGDGGLDVGSPSGGGSDDVGYQRCWSQGNVASSRKQVAPMLREAMRKRLSS